MEEDEDYDYYETGEDDAYVTDDNSSWNDENDALDYNGDDTYLSNEDDSSLVVEEDIIEDDIPIDDVDETSWSEDDNPSLVVEDDIPIDDVDETSWSEDDNPSFVVEEDIPVDDVDETSWSEDNNPSFVVEDDIPVDDVDETSWSEDDNPSLVVEDDTLIVEEDPPIEDENSSSSDDFIEMVYEIPVDETLDTGSVIPEDSTLAEVEPYYSKYNEIEDIIEIQKENLEEEKHYGNTDNVEEIQTELDILDNKQDYYTNLTNPESVNESDDESDGEPEENIYVIPIDELMKEDYPSGDTLVNVDNDRAMQDVLDLKIASDASGADPDIGISHEVIENKDDEPVITEDEIEKLDSQTETKIIIDNHLNHMDDEDEEYDLSNIIYYGYSR
jgi:hypothetical protein